MEWISVKDKLPEPQQLVFAVNSDRNSDTHVYCVPMFHLGTKGPHFSCGCRFMTCEPTHWMPLPKLPPEIE